MKQFYFLISFLLVSLFASAQNAPFITTWEIPNSSSITIPTEGTGYNYTVDFGDGTVLTNQTGDVSHYYSSPGVHTVSITGDFPRIYFYESNTANKEYLKSIEQWGDIEWTSMHSAFYGCSNLVVNAIDAPDLSQAESISYMFRGCGNFNQSIDHWDVSNIKYMNYVFLYCYIFNQPLNNWDVSNVEELQGTFYFAEVYNQPLDNWNVSNVATTKQMFYFAESFNQSLNNWDISNITDISGMFQYASSFNQPLDNWDISNVITMEEIFYSATDFNKNLNTWDVSNITDMSNMFYRANSFNQPLDSWDVSNVTNMADMFKSARDFNQPLDNWDVSNVTNMSGMFDGAQNFNQSLNSWDVSNVTTMSSMFEWALNFNQPLNSWDVSSVTDMSYMFAITEPYAAFNTFNQSLHDWDVSNVTNFTSMFYGATGYDQNLIGWQINSNALDGFLSYSGLSIQNYDLTLAQLVSLNLSDGVLGADDLEYCDVETKSYLTNTLNWTINEDNVSDQCPLNLVTGKVLFDENNDGCDVADTPWSALINAAGGDFNISTFPDDNGEYELYVPEGNFTISLPNLSETFNVAPITSEVNFNGTNNSTIVDFCLTANQSVGDLNITLIPLNQARPGLEVDYWLWVENVGTHTVSDVSASLTFDNTKQSFVSSTPNPSTTLMNQLDFDFPSISSGDAEVIHLTLQTFQPPSVNSDDILSFTASVTPNTNDYTPADNTFVYDQTVVNSYDPNDKQVLQGEEIYEEQTDEYLDYLIRFQNTGTASAINVRILDTLHPNLDYNTLKPINASHDYHIEITDGNHVEFIFDDINLPDETSDEPESQGFVAYKIKPKSNVGVGDFITGDAQIYFDFNAPIITNMVSTEVVDNLSTTTYDLSESLKVYPNPTREQVYLTTTQNIEIEKVTVYNLQGKSLLNFDKDLETLNVEDLSTGIYLMKIETNRGVINKRLIKK